MAIKITATVVVKRSALRDQALHLDKDAGSDARDYVARRIWAYLANRLPVDFVNGLLIIVEEVNGKGESKGLPFGSADGDNLSDTSF